jgi:hypothetical protein
MAGTETKTDPEYWEHVAAVRRRVEELPPEVQEHGACLGARYGALAAAIREVGGERPIRSEEYRKDVLGVLEELKEEIHGEFRTLRETWGIPEL